MVRRAMLLVAAVILTAAVRPVHADHHDVEVVVCRDVRNGEPVGRVSVFTGTDPHLCIHVTLFEVTQSHVIRWEVSRPNGSVYRSSQLTTDMPGPGSYYPRYRVWWCPSIVNREPSFTLGQWNVGVSIDGRPVRTVGFNIIGVGAGDVEKAQARVQALRTRVLANPADARAHLDLAEALVDLNQLDEAIAELHRVVDLDAQLARGHGLLGFAYYRQGLWDDAERSFLQMLRLQEDDDWAHFLLARVYVEKGDKTKAIEHFRRVVQLAGDTSLGKDALEELAKLGVVL